MGIASILRNGSGEGIDEGCASPKGRNRPFAGDVSRQRAVSLDVSRRIEHERQPCYGRHRFSCSIVGRSDTVDGTELPVSDEGRHFSGTATFTAKFEGRKGETVVLDLGDVEFAADVFVNGRKVRTLWGHPYRCEIGAFVKDGDNELRVDVTSTWFNRLAYDSALPEKDRKTWTISAPPKGTPPRPAGLLGPVTLRR